MFSLCLFSYVMFHAIVSQGQNRRLFVRFRPILTPSGILQTSIVNQYNHHVPDSRTIANFSYVMLIMLNLRFYALGLAQTLPTYVSFAV